MTKSQIATADSVPRSLSSKRTTQALCAIIASGIAIYFWIVCIAPSSGTAPNLVDVLQNGNTHEQLKVSFVQYRARNGMTFSDSDYVDLDRPIDGPEARKVLMAIEKNSLRGPLYHNHPTTIGSGTLKVEFSKSEWYYLVYRLLNCGSQRYCEIDALRRCSPNPNSATTYENALLYEMLINAEGTVSVE